MYQYFIGLRTQVVPRDDIEYVKGLIESKHTNQIADFLAKSRDLGLTLLHQVAQSQGKPP